MRRMEHLSRRALVRGAAVLAPVTVLARPGESTGLTGPVAGSARGTAGCTDGAEVARQLAKDMTGKHAGHMHGVPLTYNWAKHPRVGAGNHPERYGFHAVSAWGQVYEDADGSPANNVRVACRDISLWLLSRRTGQWRRANASKSVNGANYVEDFSGNVSKPANLRQEPDGAVSATLGGGYNFHVYALKERTVIDPSDVAGVVSLYSARVIVDDPAGPDERHLARYLASGGADYWLDEHVGAAPGTVADVGIGKARYLGPDWLTLTMSTLPRHQLEKSCPPVCLRGR
jgi:hypothetical protein